MTAAPRTPQNPRNTVNPFAPEFIDEVVAPLAARMEPAEVGWLTCELGGRVMDAVVRIDTPGEADYYRNGGILQYVLRNMLKAGTSA
jgi:hypothetical protein